MVQWGPILPDGDKKDHNNLIDENMKMRMQPIIFDFTPDSHVRVITVITVITTA